MRLTLETTSQVTWVVDARAEVVTCLLQATFVGKWLVLDV